MSTPHKVNPSRRSRWFTVVAVSALLATAAAGIAALRNTAHAVHPVATGALAPEQRAATGRLSDAWQAVASDASVPSAHEVLKRRAAPDSDASAPTF